MIRLSALLLLAVSFAQADTYTIQLDNSTTLDDGSLFTNGTTYYAAFQLTGGDASSSTAMSSNFILGGGAPVASSSNDPTSGVYLVAANPASPDGIFQPSGTLTQAITTDDAYSLYTQQFVAGSNFQFTVSLDGTYDGGIPDSFSFQLYDQGLDTLLYEQDIDILDTTPIPTAPATAPEPATLATTFGTGLLLIAAGALRRKANKLLSQEPVVNRSRYAGTRSEQHLSRGIADRGFYTSCKLLVHPGAEASLDGRPSAAV